MSRKIYVGNLPWSTTSSDLEAMFSPHGAVRSAEVISDRETGRSRGFGFVEMETDEGLQAAINALNGQEINGRPLTVNEARERTPRPVAVAAVAPVATAAVVVVAAAVAATAAAVAVAAATAAATATRSRRRRSSVASYMTSREPGVPAPGSLRPMRSGAGRRDSRSGFRRPIFFETTR